MMMSAGTHSTRMNAFSLLQKRAFILPLVSCLVDLEEKIYITYFDAFGNSANGSSFSIDSLDCVSLDADRS
jgi:galactose-1-phosphate uridylyltransferase